MAVQPDNHQKSQHTKVGFGDHTNAEGDIVGGNQQNITNNYYNFRPSEQAPTDILPFAPAAQGKSARKGLQALAELISHFGVRDVVVAFRTDFQASCEQIEVLSAYKDWHDELHKLEFRCYGVILSPVQRLLKDIEDELALEELENCILELQQIIKQIEKIAIQSCLITSIDSQIKDLKAIETDLNTGVEQSDSKRLKKATRSMYRLLGTPRSRVNDHLIATAQALRLPALVKAITSIRDSIQEQLSDCELDPNKLSEFQAGTIDLERLEQSLTLQIQNHDRWQEIDIELHRIEGDLEGDPEELELSWFDIKEIIEAQYDFLDKIKVESFCRDAERLEQAIKAQNPAKINRYFRLIRRQASLHFDEIDANLRRLCSELRRVGEPLNSVLKMLQ
jgi:hypothetical protein